ncbi:MAG TPA: mechanosensitive ion channel domain-containing protein [Pirellula sp.]|nr:mechanosensitive ion channel domain-containing protein [Pirellula sp.]
MSAQTVVFCRFALKVCIATGLLTNMAPPIFSRPNETDNISELLTPNADADSSEEPDKDDGHGQSDAVRLGEIQESLEQDEKQLTNLEQELENPSSEYALAEKEYRSLKDELDLTNEKLEAARKSNDVKKIKQLEQETSSLQTQHKLAEDRFDLAIEDRRSQREQKTTLRRKIENDKAALAAITGDGQQERSENTNQTNKATNSRKSHANVDHRNDSNDHDIRDDDRSLSNRKPQETSDSLEKSKELEVSDEQDAELTKAVDDAEEKERMADEAQEETQSIAARLADIQKLVVQEQKELNLARKKADLASAAQLTLSQELARRAAEQAAETALSELRASIGNASSRLIQARSEVAEISERLNDHRAEQSSLQSEHIVALHEAEKKRQEAKDAENRIDEIRNPFTLRNILHWLIEHGPRILAIVSGMFILNWLSSFFAARSVRLVTTSSGRGSKLEKENRAKTLVGVFQNASTVGIFIAGVMMVLEEIGANITVLMGGVAVIGLAVAFGAQNLIKDYFYGFVMLLENQYMLNDSVRVGGVSGQVERITLRMTVLRDSNGVVHFIPNGTINSVSNETHGWSRAVCEIAVGHHESLDRICEILNAISLELKADTFFGSLLLETPTSPAIESLGESAVYLKMSAKTLPNKQGAIKQEWLKRIKNRFWELGIQHPFPQRSVHIQSVHVQSEDSVSEQNGLVLTPPAPYRQAG